MPNGNPAPGPLNSRYFRPVRGKETRARRWDLQFESTSLQRRVRNEPDPLAAGTPVNTPIGSVPPGYPSPRASAPLRVRLQSVV